MVFDSVFTVKNDRDSMLSKILSLHYNKYYLDKRKKPRSRLSEMERNTVMKQSLYYKPTRLEFKKTK